MVGRQKLQEMLLNKLQTTELLSLVGDVQVMSILDVLSAGTARFTNIQETVSMSSKTLSSRLKALEKHGLVSRTLHAEVPPRVEYALTEKGREFISIIRGFLDWETAWQA